MSARTLLAVACIALPMALVAACTEQPQVIGGNAKPNKAGYKPAYDGTGTAFQVPGWKPGDKNSWEQELKTRTQMGQNDYNKVP